MSENIVVVDYKIGNIFSVCNALKHIGFSPVLSSDPNVIKKADRLILPGVGSFGSAMKNIRSNGHDESIFSFISTGRPFLGICIGMQVLMDISYELGEHKGLSLIKGSVIRIPHTNIDGSNLSVPHIAWSKVSSRGNHYSLPLNCPSYDIGLQYYYFIHSYMCMPLTSDCVYAHFEYGGHLLNAAIGHDNIIGVQFHPERSGHAGLAFLNRLISGS